MLPRIKPYSLKMEYPKDKTYWNNKLHEWIDAVIAENKANDIRIAAITNGLQAVIVPQAMTDTDKPASKRQLWYLYCITKQDHREKSLTYTEASQLISDLLSKRKAA